VSLPKENKQFFILKIFYTIRWPLDYVLHKGFFLKKQSIGHLIVSFITGKTYIFLKFFVINFYKTFFFIFVLTYFVFTFQVTEVLSIASSATPPFQKVCEICHVYCNVCHSKSKVHKSCFL
jgi:hypothetical protein